MDGEYDLDLPFVPNVIVDAGANIGLASVFFSRRFPDAKLFALEPDAESFAMLQRHAKDKQKWTVLPFALWCEDTLLQMKRQTTDSWGRQVGIVQDSTMPPVNAIGLTTLMQRFQIDKIDVLKIDIEGAEFEVFSKNYAYWLARTRLIFLEVHAHQRPGVQKVIEDALQTIRHARSTLGENLLIMNTEVM